MADFTQRQPVSEMLAASQYPNAMQRRSAAKQELMRTRLEISALIEPKSASEEKTVTNYDGSTYTYRPYSHKNYLESRVSQLIEVISEPLDGSKITGEIT